MKLSNILLLSTSSIAFAAPAVHHDHNEKRALVTVTEFVDENGNAIVGASATATASAAVKEQAVVANTDVTSSKATTTLEGTVATTTSSTSTAAKTSTGSTSSYGDLSAYSGPNKEFQDGTISCSDFPSGQGVVSVDWAGLSGWSTIMDMNGNTATSCQDGYYCSYACQAGMSKTQWPSEQPSNGMSVGGLYCKNGLLYRSNTDSNYLCEWGQDSAVAVNNADKSIAMCRTDYPGSENMVIPTLVEAGSSQPVSVVNEDSYYQWQGKKTSTQYYVNNAGVSAEDGCVWGTEGSGVGNWAPVVLGAGYTDGITYLSIIPNPNNKTPPNFNIKIVASEGSTVNGECSYVDGVYTGSGSDGCTVSVTSGSAEFVFY
ncbi:similar to Saccharomyces cerevisiae YJL116C NCA3 Protein that functions with Nca2p to regulate mitochondrial expression of subunits 6 (Atp6p) and 8 (Atp8p) of the Fo-F1 ATP synthase [Maudiozyma saulgeensis]|uniref:Similar to Saccharomyces cerevisiae YJL116C NCA3 Protein that functions with Nca2p to regulate mitochondrial expression of subunits 6 (Atp6p) and 8 (Atp8p ) of the Fo-F1 ATP synthase n=1 Tax=Maudiozyma saulgeensis TaxID=1789683 RepID=A0A1X7R1E4_9SACH|nr:similar to Saccharomyces cerevisiae YJL116C NCA3 Protein that functions with Nca2p to regulate mitochondrial expression of subunits 6 (Atp6p) and 8 (Atp8p) of the Fo-F1 ATP synthase [Kazachstania saulgeensis]